MKSAPGNIPFNATAQTRSVSNGAFHRKLFLSFGAGVQLGLVVEVGGGAVEWEGGGGGGAEASHV